MENGKFMARAADALFGPRIKGTVLAVHKDQDGNKKVIVDRGADSIAIDQVRSLKLGPFKFVTRPEPNKNFKSGDIFDARTSKFKPWIEGQVI